MAKVSAPLLSFGGLGQIGKSMVFATWRGVSYTRRYVVPANPKSTSQTVTRGVFAWLNAVWKQLSPNVTSVWLVFAKGRPLTDRNAWIKANLSALRGTDIDPATDLSGMVMSPGANAGLAAAGIAAADDMAHGFTVTLTAPDLPDGWAIVKAHFVALKQQEADTGQLYTSLYAFDAATPFIGVFAGGHAGTWATFGFFEFTKPDGTTAYSPSLYAQVVVA